jgi:alkylation response protein AidB-like acyl-CoA dehydrogenase
MDFALSADQDALRDLAHQILGDACTTEHLSSISASESGTDLALWRTLADAGLVGINLPEAAGGGGYGWLEAAIVLSEIGRVAAPVPGLGVMALAAPALAAVHGDHPELLAGVAAGEQVVTAAIHEHVGDPWTPTASVTDGVLVGTKVCVTHGLLATRFVVTAADGLYSVEATAPGVGVARQDTTSGVPDALVTFDRVPALRIGGVEATRAMLRRAQSAACVMIAASCQTALALTAEYTRARTQFDRPIASFQAVSQRAGDAYIDTEGVKLTAWQAAWRLDQGLPSDEALLTAKYWAAEGGWRVMHAAHHLHGGVGVDRDYPLHRHFLNHKQLELQVGSATPSLLRLGRILADTPV